jgi:hypothetical protein
MLYNAPYGAAGNNDPYVNGNPTTGTMGSIPPAASIEFPQREIVAVIQYAADNGLIDFNNVPCGSPSNGDLTQLLKAIFGLTNQHKLQADQTIYINSSTGDDTLGDGTSGKPYRSYQVAVNAAQARFDLNQKHTLTFHGTGTFTFSGSPTNVTPCYIAGQFAGQAGPGSVIFDNTNATFNTTHGTCFYLGAGAAVTILNGTYSASWDGVSDSQGVAITVSGNATCFHRGGTFNACDVAHWWNYGFVWVYGSYTIAGNAKYHIVAQPQSSWGAGQGPYSINVVGTPTFQLFADCYGGNISFGGASDGASFSGAANGQKYFISGYGTISTNGRGVNFLPGSTAGTIAANTGNGEYT